MMRNAEILIFVLTVLVLTTSNAAAQRLPDELTFPRHTEKENGADGNENGQEGEQKKTGTLFISTGQNLFDNSFTSTNDILYTPGFGAVSLEQSVWHEFRRDKFGNTRHYLNTAGALEYPLEKYAWITPGLDWTPIAQYSSDPGGINTLATLDAGPTVRFSVMSVPFFLRGGVSGRRADSLAGFIKAGEYRSNVGAYGSFSAGSEEELLPFAPVYFNIDGLGRRIENSGMASLSSSALGALRVGEDDSVFVYGKASVFNGREGYLEESADSRAALFAETPWRIEQDAGFTAGYKGAPKYGVIEPSVYYGVSQNTLEFPNDTRKRDEKTIRQTLSGAVSTDSAAGVYYSGSLGFVWRDHDKLFGADMPTAQTQGNADSLEVNLWDYTAFEPRTAHRLAVKLPWQLRLKYDFSLSRFLTEYPNYYVSGRDTVRNKDDSDRRSVQHRLALEHRNDSSMRAELFGELTGYDLVFLRQAKSSGNRTDNGQKIGVLFEWSPAAELLLTEAVTAEAKRGEFHFPEFHRKALQRPRYSRAVSSSMSCDWQASTLLGLSGKWDIKYSDYGFWYGKEYMSETPDKSARTDYYAITSKSVYTTTDLAARFNIIQTVLEAGGAFTAAKDRNCESGNYIIANENDYSIKPYINAEINLWDWGELSTHISRTFVTSNSTLSYWDFRLKATCGF